MITNNLVDLAESFNEEVERVRNELLNSIKQEAEEIYNEVTDKLNKYSSKIFDVGSETVNREDIVVFKKYLFDIFKGDIFRHKFVSTDRINVNLLLEYYSLDSKIQKYFRYVSFMEKLDIDHIKVVAE